MGKIFSAVFRPVMRSAANGLQVCMSLWGASLTDEFFWLFIAVAVVGTFNLIMSFQDERRIRISDQKADEDRELLRDMKKHMHKLLGPTEIPAHLQNLTKLTDAQIKIMVEAVNGRLRDFQRRINAAKYASYGNENNRDLMLQMYQDEHTEYYRDYRPEAMALWNELSRRLPDAPEPEYGVSGLKHGQLAGPNPVEAVATELERLSRMLSDD